MEKAQKTSLHVAGGEHKGIVINKDVQAEGDEVMIVVTIIVYYSHRRQRSSKNLNLQLVIISIIILFYVQVEPAHLCLEFRVFLVNASTGRHAQVTI